MGEAASLARQLVAIAGLGCHAAGLGEKLFPRNRGFEVSGLVNKYMPSDVVWQEFCGDTPEALDKTLEPVMVRVYMFAVDGAMQSRDDA